MSQYWILAAILLPILGSLPIPLLPFRQKRGMYLYIEAIVLVTSVIVWGLLLGGTTSSFEVVHFINNLSIAFKIDGMTMVFAGLVAVLWPLATLYAFEYMEHEHHEKAFFMFYTMTFGVTLGIAFASDMVTMYFFYELLTLVTVPLVMHSLTREAILAVRKYLYFSLGGAAFALMSMIFVMVYGYTCEFHLGGVFSMRDIRQHGNIRCCGTALPFADSLRCDTQILRQCFLGYASSLAQRFNLISYLHSLFSLELNFMAFCAHFGAFLPYTYIVTN